MAYNSPKDLISALLSNIYNADAAVAGSNYNPFRVVQPIRPQDIQTVGPMTPAGQVRNTQPYPHTEQLYGQTTQSKSPKDSNQAKINISIPATKLFEADNSETSSLYPMSYKVPYPDVGQATNMTRVGQAGPSLTPYMPGDEKPYYSQMSGK